MYALAAWGQAPFAGTVLPPTSTGELPPPIPGEPAQFSYASSLGAYPWAYATWAGGYSLPAYPGGGILAYPQTSDGTMKLLAWWPSASTLQIVRIGADGARTPVRGAFPVVVTEATRVNTCTNPSIEVGTNGYVPDAGSPTLTQVADAAAPAGSYILRATNAGSGSNGVTVPTGLVGPLSATTVTVSWSMRTSARPTSVTLSISWTNSAGQALTANSATLTADQINASVNTFARQALTVTPPAGAITPTVKITCGGMPAGGQMDLDAIVVEQGTTAGTAFDGTTLGAIWSGTAHLSTSTLSPIHTIYDGECPTDVLVTYQVSYPGITGGRVVSDPAYLDSGGNTWLSHPAAVLDPVKVQLSAAPVLERALSHGIFWPLGKTNPVVITDTGRRAPAGSVELVWLSFAERDVLLAMLADGQPLLLRPPGEFGYDAMWLAFLDVTEDRGERKPWQDAGVLSADVQQVDRPEDS